MINTEMDADAGGSDTIAASVAESVAAALAHNAEMESDTHGQGTTVGDLVALPTSPDIDSTILNNASN